ncbi:unnamed protein product, partial [Mesorhabditis belari]|uniref:Uncharacterized protein n=1 Tax=Mesorhabditis belari TaxID=2138241 RepID=A0AAF3EV00_9BILA
MEPVFSFFQPINDGHPKTLSWSPTDEGEGVPILIGMPALWVIMATQHQMITNPIAYHQTRKISGLTQYLIQSKQLSAFYLRSPKVSFQLYRVKLIITVNELQKSIFLSLSDYFIPLALEDNPFLCLTQKCCFTNFLCNKFRYRVSVAFLKDFQAPGFGWDSMERVSHEEFRENLRQRLLFQWGNYISENGCETNKSGLWDLRSLLMIFYDWEKACVDGSHFMAPTEFAHRITKNEVFPGRSPPSIPRLKWQLVYNKLHDGPLIGCPGLFFSTTLFQKGLGNKSPFPIGGKSNAGYHRVTIPLKFLENNQMWYQRNPSPRWKGNRRKNSFQYQVLLILADEKDAQHFQNLPKYYEPFNFRLPNPFLYLRNEKWWANNQNSIRIDELEIRYTVSLVLLKDFEWIDGCEWKGDVRKLNDCTAMNIDDNIGARDELAMMVLRQWGGI